MSATTHDGGSSGQLTSEGYGLAAVSYNVRGAGRAPDPSLGGRRLIDQAGRSLFARSVNVSRPPSDRMEERAMSGDMTAGREADSARSQDQSGAIDRRDALKKAARGRRCGGVDDSGRTGRVVGHRARPDGDRLLTCCHHHGASDRGELRMRARSRQCLLQRHHLAGREPDRGLRPDVCWRCRGGGPRRVPRDLQAPGCAGSSPSTSSRAPAARLRSRRGFRSGAPTGRSTCSTGRSPPCAWPVTWSWMYRRRSSPRSGVQRRDHDVDGRSAGSAHERGAHHHDDRSGGAVHELGPTTKATEPGTEALPAP